MRNRWPILVLCPASLIALWSAFSLLHTPVLKAQESGTKLLSGPAAMGDWTNDAPGVRRRITVNDLPLPSSNVLSINRARVVKRPAGAELQVPPGFKIELYAEGFRDPRYLFIAPNGDIFIAESRADQIKVLRDTKIAASRASQKYLPSAI